jgi:hypothetical protein
VVSVITGFLIAAGVWLVASIPFALFAGRMLARISDDYVYHYPPLGDDDE